MRNKCEQMSLFDIYQSVAASMEDDKPKLFRLLDEHIDWNSLIPARFYLAFYRNAGKLRKYLHAAKLTRFKQDFLPYIIEVSERLVELTEPICREMDAELGDSLICDTTGVESCIAIVRHIAFFDDAFNKAHLEIPIGKRMSNPDADKKLANLKTLLPVLRDLNVLHPELHTQPFWATGPLTAMLALGQLYRWVYREAAIRLRIKSIDTATTMIAPTTICVK